MIRWEIKCHCCSCWRNAQWKRHGSDLERQKGNSGHQHSPSSLRSLTHVILRRGVWGACLSDEQGTPPFLFSQAVSTESPLWACARVALGLSCTAQCVSSRWQCPSSFTNKQAREVITWQFLDVSSVPAPGQVLWVRNVYEQEAWGTHARKEPLATHSSNSGVIRAMNPNGVAH